MTAQHGTPEQPFRLEEATIEEVHAAITSGQITCVEIVQHYLARVRAYNGVASVLVTPNGAPIPEAMGAVRAQAPLRFPTHTIKASTILPDLDRYTGPPLEFGRMEATASDPTVPQQFGMIAGIPNGGQLNALATLNIRGERSVTCRGDFDRHPSEGPLPPGAPPICDEFRRLPDALECAAELDATYRRHPDLEQMPMYGVVFSFKDPFDTKDMRTAAGGDAHSSNLDLTTIQQQELAMTFRFHLRQYLLRRAADWQARGFTETLVDVPTLNARSKFWGDDQRAALQNWEEVSDPRNPLDQRQGVNERIMLRELLRRVDMMVLLENHLDALVRRLSV